MSEQGRRTRKIKHEDATTETHHIHVNFKNESNHILRGRNEERRTLTHLVVSGFRNSEMKALKGKLLPLIFKPLLLLKGLGDRYKAEVVVL